MYLTILLILLGLSFVLIALGLFRPEHTELSLIGFVFLFLVALVILGNAIEYKVGTDTTTNFTYDNETNLLSTYEVATDVYESVTLENNYTHLFGYWLAVVAIIGFLGVLLSLRKDEALNG